MGLLTHYRHLRLLSLVLLGLLSACSQQPQVPQQAQSILPIPDEWQLHAKLGIRQNDDSGSVTLQWQQQQQQYHIRVSGPLGQGNGVIRGNAHSIIIERPNRTPLYSNSPDQLLEETFGWRLPITQLPYWVRGLPSPDGTPTQQHYDESALLHTLSQDGWQIRYERYKDISGWLMPGKITATKEDIRLKLIIKQWQFLTVTASQ